MAIDEHSVELRYGSSFIKTDPGCFFFSGMPTPYLSRSQEMVYQGKQWCQATTLTLAGQIIGSVPVEGENLNTLSILDDRRRILSGFSESFQKLGVFENNTLYKNFEGCIIQDVSFSPSNWGVQEYTITLECYEKDDGGTDIFLGTFGVLDPKDSVNFTDNKDGSVGISHAVSAQGFTTNTASDGADIAIINAKNFVESRTGYNINKIAPQFIGNISNDNLLISNISRDINRADGTYGCTVDYTVQTGNIGEIPISAGHLSIIDTTVNSGIDSEFIEVSLNYTLQGDKYINPVDLRNASPSTGTLWKIATGSSEIENLARKPLTLSVDDQADTTRMIKVAASFDNNTIFENLDVDVYFDYNVDVSTDDVTDTASVNINGELIARGNNQDQFRLKSGVLNTYFNDSYLFVRANEIYTGLNYNVIYGDTAWSLNPTPASKGNDMDPLKGTIKINASFTNKDYRENYKDFAWTTNVTPSLNRYSAKPSCNQNGLYKVFNVNSKTREKISLSINSQAARESATETPKFNFLGDMHDYANLLRVSMINSQGKDIIVDSESNVSPQILSSEQSDLKSSISQNYNYIAPRSFYQ